MPIINTEFATLFQSLYNFFENHNDLVGFMEACEEPDHSWDIQNDPIKRDRVFAEFTRLFHNWLAASASLVDHCRRLVRNPKFLTELVLREYHQKISTEFSEDPLHRFITGLRNFALHVDHPMISMTTQFRMDAGVVIDHRWGVTFGLEDLRSRQSWHKKALEFIDGYSEDPFVHDIVLSYHEKVSEFWSNIIARNREDMIKNAYWIDNSRMNGEL